MSIRIAIPEPSSSDAEYNARSLPPYIAALQASGASPVLVPLHESQARVARIVAETQGVLLPGSKFDVDPQRYGESRIPQCGPSDPGRTAVDELLLQDAFNLDKPVLAICHGAQTLNVWLNGTLIQDLETILHTPINHQPGRDIVNAHAIRVSPESRLGRLSATLPTPEGYCNSSHHQAIGRVGDNLRITAVSPADNVVESIELESPDHFVLGVQWHPERTYSTSSLSRSIFSDFIRSAGAWHPRNLGTSVVPE